jgi:diadenosine tetraphosphate (Ap4A) HIT family hydrolase
VEGRLRDLPYVSTHMKCSNQSVERFWDPSSRYGGGVLKIYEHWCLEVSFRQHTPGSFIIFSRHHVERLSELPIPALVELGTVTGQIEEALYSDAELQPDRFNYLQLGNTLHHLHIHGIPRYAAPRYVGGRNWVDSTFGDLPRWTNEESPQELVEFLRDRLSLSLGALRSA